MPPERAPNLGKHRPTVAERRQILTDRIIEQTLEWYGEYSRAARIGFTEETRPDITPYAKLVGPARVFKFERVRAVDQPFLQRVMTLQILSMPNHFPKGLNADELVAEVKSLAGGQMSKAEQLSQDRDEWPKAWLDAANAVSNIDRAVEGQQHSPK